MISVDIIPMMPNVKVAYRIFGPLAILCWRRAHCLHTSMFCRPHYLHPHWTPCYCLFYCFCVREMEQTFTPWWPWIPL